MESNEDLNSPSDLDGESLNFFNKARDEMDVGRLEAAVELFSMSNGLRPHYKTCLLLGECLLSLSRFGDAVIPLAAAAALNRQGIAPTLLAETLLALNQPDKAYEFVQLALERQPSYKRAQQLEPVAREAAERLMREIFGK
jgi:tetratricopeptide (TPR) repeat protein